MKSISVAALLTLAILSAPACADQCSDYLSAAKAEMSPEKLTALLKVATKGEYETSDAFQSRMNALVPGGIVAVSISLPESAASYDADRARLVLKSPLSISDEIILDHDAMAYFEGVSIKDARKSGGEYVGQNAFGARARVSNESMQSIGIAWKTFPQKNFSPADTISIALAPQAGQAERKRLRLLMIGNVIAPYVVKDSDVSMATIDNPMNFQHDKKSLVVDPVCAAIYDPSARAVSLASWDAQAK